MKHYPPENEARADEPGDQSDHGGADSGGRQTLRARLAYGALPARWSSDFLRSHAEWC